MNRFFVGAALAAVLLLAGIHSAQANTITGRLWLVPEAVTLNAVPANVPATTPDVTFDVNSPMNFNATSATISAWLATSSAFNIVENTAGTLSSLMDDGAYGALLEFTGFVSVTNGQTFTVTHDDGLTLIIGTTNLGFSPLPTAPVTSTATYTGPSGDFAFQLVYTECCGGPAVLQIDLPFSNTPAVPLPSAAWMGMGLLGSLALATRIRRRMRLAA
ncbi:MAG TPA: hypothetical protein VGQ99_13365 [Tepidisphaeraceae bacterium]|nr:hypothetical protein [Tepidisphaeraceae bacterium]